MKAAAAQPNVSRTTMTRILLAAVALALSSSTSADAQALFGGFAQDALSGRPLRCICVALQDSSGRTVDSTWTKVGGKFQFFVGNPGRFRLRFMMGGMADVVTDWESLLGDTTVARAFKIPVSLDSIALIRAMRGEQTDTLLRMKRSSAVPRYPRDLREERVPGGVVIAFAVDTTGRIDTSTVLALRATHQQFLNSVQAAVPRMRFEPFSLSGGPDCVLAVQPFLFRFDLTIRY
jgi:TonB family protein